MTTPTRAALSDEQIQTLADQFRYEDGSIDVVPFAHAILAAASTPAPDARAAVIEECAKVCDAQTKALSSNYEPITASGAQKCSAAIRALIGTPEGHNA